MLATISHRIDWIQTSSGALLSIPYVDGIYCTKAVDDLPVRIRTKFRHEGVKGEGG